MANKSMPQQAVQGLNWVCQSVSHLLKWHRSQSQAWVISYPKSGRTWHRVLMGGYFCIRHGLDLRDSADMTEHLMSRLNLPTLRYSHNGANFLDPWDADDPRVADPNLWRGSPVIFLIRDLKDTLVSSYFHARYRDRTFSGTISDFVRDPRTGAEKILTALNRWHANRSLAQTYLVQSYEQMHKDPEGCLEEALKFVGVTPVDRSAVRQAAVFSSAENMRMLEQSGFFRSHRLTKPLHPNAAKVRSARIGDYQNHLKPSDIDYIDDLERRIGSPLGKIKRLAADVRNNGGASIALSGNVKCRRLACKLNTIS